MYNCAQLRLEMLPLQDKQLKEQTTIIKERQGYSAYGFQKTELRNDGELYFSNESLTVTKTVVVVNVLHWSVSILKKRQIIFKGEGGGAKYQFFWYSRAWWDVLRFNQISQSSSMLCKLSHFEIFAVCLDIVVF